MDQVVAEAGFTKGALYRNFAGKTALFLALMDQQVNARLYLLDDLSRSGPVDPRQLGTVLTNAAMHDPDWQLLFPDYWARAVRDPLLRDGFLLHRRRLRGHITKAVTALLGQQGTAKSLPAEHFATLALALSNGLAIEGLVDPDGLFGEVLSTDVGCVSAHPDVPPASATTAVPGDAQR